MVFENLFQGKFLKTNYPEYNSVFFAFNFQSLKWNVSLRKVHKVRKVADGETLRIVKWERVKRPPPSRRDEVLKM